MASSGGLGQGEALLTSLQGMGRVQSGLRIPPLPLIPSYEREWEAGLGAQHPLVLMGAAQLEHNWSTAGAQLLNFYSVPLWPGFRGSRVAWKGIILPISPSSHPTSIRPCTHPSTHPQTNLPSDLAAVSYLNLCNTLVSNVEVATIASSQVRLPVLRKPTKRVKLNVESKNK